MHLARVTGAVVSTQKSPSLIGKKLLLVRRVSADGELPASPTSVNLTRSREAGLLSRMRSARTRACVSSG